MLNFAVILQLVSFSSALPIYSHFVFVSDPLFKLVPEFNNNHGSTFRGANQLMKLIALQSKINPNRQVELTRECLNKTCTIIHNEGRSNEDVTPLYWSCRTAQSETALLLLQSGASVKILATRSIGEPASPLFWAVNNGMSKVVEKLLEAGADVHTVELKDCANDVIAGMIKKKIAERDKIGKKIIHEIPTQTKTPIFQPHFLL